MSANAIQLQVSQFSTNVELLLQQVGSKLRGLVSTGTHTGKQASPVDQVGLVEVQTPAGRFAPLGRVDATVTRRWVFPVDKDLPQLFDNFDKLRLISDPKSVYGTNAANAFGRAWDREIVNQALATAFIGETGTGTEAFDTTNYSIANDFGAAAATGLTVKKLIEVKRMFRTAEVDLDNDPATIIIGPKQEADLLNQAQVTSSDFNKNGGVLTDGVITRFMGFNIVVSNRLNLVSTDRQLIAFVKSGLYLGMWADLENIVSQRNDLSSHPWQLYSKATFGATRLQQGKIVRVLASEA